MDRTALSIRIPKALWQKMEERVEDHAGKNPSLWPPLVFALYTKEDNHYEIIDYREITTVKAHDDDYKYPGTKELGFYPPKGTGKWFSGTLVVGDGTELDEGDRKWMVRDKMDFRIKMDKGHTAKWSYKTYCIDFPTAALHLF